MHSFCQSVLCVEETSFLTSAFFELFEYFLNIPFQCIYCDFHYTSFYSFLSGCSGDYKMHHFFLYLESLFTTLIGM